MQKKNPFTTSFGKEPLNFISRYDEENEILDTFGSESPMQQVYMITGVRGSGKTALLTRLKRKLSEDKKWIIIEVNPNTEMLGDLISRLCDVPYLRSSFVKAKLNLSVFGIDLGLENNAPIDSKGIALHRMLKIINRLGKRLLVTVDEATNNKEMRAFSGEFQILLRENLPVYLVMTGLYKNIYDLQNEKTLTFLYRAPKIILRKLNNLSVINSYKDIFQITTAEAKMMADKVKGYAFAYQLYGSLCYEHNGREDTKDIDSRYEAILGELVYEKQWSELSSKDREIMTVIAKNGDTPVKTGNIIEAYNKTYPSAVQMTDKLMSVYRERLKREGIIESPKYGYIQICLPQFDKYINEYGYL